MAANVYSELQSAVRFNQPCCHTHYNELANDGTTIFTTTRSTGQVEAGPDGFSIVSLYRGVVSWRFKPLQSSWRFVMITARTWAASEVTTCRCRIDDGAWGTMRKSTRSSPWEFISQAPLEEFTLSAWPERHLLGTRLGPNRNRRK
jgi:hypothetical protein